MVVLSLYKGIYEAISEMLKGNFSNNSLSQFTTLSNLLVLIVACIEIIVISFHFKKKKMPIWIPTLKGIATAEILQTLTLVTIATIAVEEAKPEVMFGGVELFTHLLIPIICLIQFVTLEDKPIKLWKTALIAFLVCVPYVTVYCLETRVSHLWIDFYWLWTWGDAVGVAFICICSVLIVGLMSLLTLLRKIFAKFVWKEQILKNSFN